MSDESRTTKPGDVSPDEPTVAIPAQPAATQPASAQPADEATVAIPAQPAPTQAGSAQAASAQAESAQAAKKPADEATAVIRPGTPSDEPTVPLKAAAAAALLKAIEPAAAPKVSERAAPPKVNGPAAPPKAAEPATEDEDEDEATEVVPAAASADEATEAIPADTEADETTTVMGVDNQAEEATTVIPAKATPDETAADDHPDEVTTAFRVGKPADETTTAFRVRLPADETTTVIPAGTAQDDATVAMSAAEFKPRPAPVADATVALPTKMPDRPAAIPPAPQKPREPREPHEPQGPQKPLLTRRRLIFGLSGAAGVAAAAAAIAVATGSDDDKAGKDQAKPTSGQPVIVTSRKPESATVTASPLPVQRKPISTLAEYTKAAGVKPFSSDSIALTIDDGPHPIWTPKILELLDHYQIPAMFCMIGNQVLGHEAVAKMVTGAGHQLANHTWSHPTHLGAKPSKVAQKEIQKAQSKITKTTGYVPKLFRSPGGDWSPKLLQDIAKAGLLPLDWSNDPRDWTMPGAPTIEKRMLAAKPGQILLCHDGGGDRSQTYKALSVVLPQLKARGLQFVEL